MTQKKRVNSIWVYPIKSFDGVEIRETQFSDFGGLKHDRVFALKDISDNYINAKNNPEIIKIRAKFNLNDQEVIFSFKGKDNKFNLEEEQGLIEDWFSDFLNKKVHLHKNIEMGFPDDKKRPGPTVYSLQSLELVQKEFPDLNIDELRRRFRGNIELYSEQNGFWEDELLNSETKPGVFQIGKVKFKAVKPCPRCPVPSRDSVTSDIYRGFQKKYSDFRKANTFINIDKGLFPHYYMFAINTAVFNPEQASIKVGDELMLH